MADKQQEKKSAPILTQMGIFAAILFISSLISNWLATAIPSFPVPTPVLGLVILYVLLSTKIIKLEWVDNFGSLMISLIGFMFVPSGISLATSLDLMAKQGVQIVIVVIISTVLMLVITAYTAWLLIGLKNKISKNPISEEEFEAEAQKGAK
ncbi:effector of murein hydrolase LrgA [Paucilactobacillus oligofermentans DSM 15707 = LMG 22743]|uniref:Effector of murein hydrolase LrgA n=1 Tax=Paucilactobacillus oligofermentans DSM 15707 = LMG 22743 TaxID=1423778 RepID=A0A0R1RMZ9_9LACO|nr:CidA/LrgA family protein [Paucilactobacillus oligofermentans]KRL55554.1 effector of murein hydrolase LrgA [Paucilactobacillus oligofermentans DSM 15707 = LMG 22743]CUS25458.1 Antiholin-like protein LrgA [Paucilactobacillus oligofermentans DSM 15707 = LMG 22743]